MQLLSPPYTMTSRSRPILQVYPLTVTPSSNAHRLQIAWNCDSHFCSPVLDWTGPDCSPRVSDRTVRSFYRSPFELKTGLFFSQTGPYFSVWTAVPIGRTVRSGLFQRSTNKATVRTGPDRGQSTVKPGPSIDMQKKQLAWCLLYKDWILED